MYSCCTRVVSCCTRVVLCCVVLYAHCLVSSCVVSWHTDRRVIKVVLNFGNSFGVWRDCCKRASKDVHQPSLWVKQINEADLDLHISWHVCIFLQALLLRTIYWMSLTFFNWENLFQTKPYSFYTRKHAWNRLKFEITVHILSIFTAWSVVTFFKLRNKNTYFVK